MYELETEKPFDRNTIGRIKVKCTKDGIAAGVPKERVIELGGDGNDAILVCEVQVPLGAGGAFEKQRIRDEIERRVEEDGPLTQNQLVDLVVGKRPEVIRQAKDLAASDLSPVRSKPGKRGSIEYFWLDDSDDN